MAIDPFGDLGARMAGRRRFDYAPVPSHSADLLLVTHEHADHNAVDSEHDDQRAAIGAVDLLFCRSAAAR